MTIISTGSTDRFWKGGLILDMMSPQGTASAGSRCRKKGPATSRAFFALRSRWPGLSICRGHLGQKSTEWFGGLLGKIAIQRPNLLRLGHECLEGRLGEVGLNFNRLVERFRARELLHKRPGVFKRFLGVVTVSCGNRLEAAREGIRRNIRGVDLFLATLLLERISMILICIRHYEMFLGCLTVSQCRASPIVAPTHGFPLVR